MKLKLSIFTLLFLSSLTPLPAQAGIWEFIRNSVAVSYVFGKPTEVNYTIQTRLPVIEARPSFWSRITNFFAWRNFTAQAQPAAAPQPVPPVAPAPVQEIQMALSPEISEHLVNRLDAMRVAHEATKLEELANQEKTQKLIYDLREQKIVLKQNIEKAEQKAEHHFKGWTSLSNAHCEQEKLIDIQRKELARAKKEKEELISAIGQVQEESAQLFYTKNVALEALRKLQLEVEKSTKSTQEHCGRLEQKILKLKKELKEIRSEKMISEEELHRAKHSVSRIESELKTLVAERNSLDQDVTTYRTQKDSLAFQLRELESKYSTDQRKTKNDLDTEKKSHDQTKKDLEKSKQQASVAISSSIELNKQLGKKNEEIQNVQQVYNAEIAEIQQLLSKKRSEIDLVMAKLEREEKQEKEVITTVNNFERQMTAVFDRFAVSNIRLNSMSGKLTNNQQRLELLRQHSSQKIAPEKGSLEQVELLNTIIITLKQEISDLNARPNHSLAELHATKAEIERKTNQYMQAMNKKIQLLKQAQQSTSTALDEVKETNVKLAQELESGGKLENTQNRLTYLPNNLPKLPVIVSLSSALPMAVTQSAAPELIIPLSAQANSSGVSSELLQSALGTQNPDLNKSVTGALVDEFAQLSHTPSPELNPDQPNGSESIYQHIQVDPAHYQAKAQKGRTLLQQICQGNFLQPLKLKSPDEHLEVIENILYRLHQNASYKGQGFLEGTYVIQDTENFDLFNTLLSYIQKVNPEVTGTAKDPLAHVSLNPFAYPRDASHYTHNKKKHPFYGIDLRRSDYSTFSLPGDHAHLLIGFVDKDKKLIFIKPEHKGIYILDGWLGHCNEFVTAQTRKNNLLGKSVRWVAGWLGYEITTDDNELYRKERIPADFLKQFGLILAQEEALTAEQKQQLTAKAKQLGIQTLIDDRIAQSEAFQQMKNAYRAKYDNLEHRSGREVHCNLQQLITLEQ